MILLTPAKPVEFLGSSLEDLRNFPADARQEADDDDWLRGARDSDHRFEWCLSGDLLAKFADTVYVLHCFQKKTQRTAKQDLDLATRRYNDLARKLKP